MATATKVNLRGSEGDDLLRGFEGNDQLRGNGGNDALFGGAGFDRLWGGDGDDRLEGQMFDWRSGEGPSYEVNFMRGGAGDDTYFVNSIGDRVIEKAGEGTETVITRVGFTLPDHVENLEVAYEGKIYDSRPLVGNALDNNIVFASQNINTILGLAGNDTLIDVGKSRGFLDGGDGDDVLINGGQSLGGQGADLFVAVKSWGDPGVGTRVIDFDGAEGDRVHISWDTNMDAAQLFEEGRLSFNDATGRLDLLAEPNVPQSVQRTIQLLGVEEFDPSWVTVGLFAEEAL